MAKPRQYGTYMPYVKPKPPPAKPKPYNPYAPYDPNSGRPPTPPGVSLISKLYPTYDDHTEAEWQKLLNARVKPYEDAVGKVRDMDEGRAEFQFEQARDANERLSQGFVGLLTGGKTGEEGAQYAKENFGGQYMPLEAVSIAHQHLTELTSDWNDRDWEIASQYQKAMAEIPGLKEQMRESITKEDTDEYTRKFNVANLLLDEAWNVYNANAKQYNTTQQLKAARDALGLKGYDNRKDAVAEMTKQAAQSNYKWGVRRASDGSWEAYQTNQLKPKKTSTSQAVRNSALREASDMTRVGNVVWRVRKTKGGGWEAYPTTTKKVTSTKKGSTLSDAQKAENDLLGEFYGNKSDYIGVKKANPGYLDTDPPGPQFITEGGMSFSQAYDQLFDQAYATLQPYGRTRAYVDKWVKQRLYALYPGSKASSAKPRGG